MKLTISVVQALAHIIISDDVGFVFSADDHFEQVEVDTDVIGKTFIQSNAIVWLNGTVAS